VRKESVTRALPQLYAALDEQRSEQVVSDGGGLGFFAFFLGALGIVWGANR